MKNVFSILCLVLFLTSCSEKQEGEVIHLQERKGLMFESNQEKPFTGKYIEYSVFGQEKKRAEKNYKDGKRNGLSTLWYESGQMQSKANYTGGKQNGLETVWYMNGQKGAEGNYKDGKRDGLWMEWHTNGPKWKVINYKGGKEDGLWTEWSDEGTITKKATYKSGALVND
jgi:antitoxin component YwqK of YwqJK toxin-antitoxin module